MSKLKIKPKLAPIIEPLLEEMGVCCYCGNPWVLRYSPKKCPRCGYPQFLIEKPNGERTMHLAGE